MFTKYIVVGSPSTFINEQRVTYTKNDNYIRYEMARHENFSNVQLSSSITHTYATRVVSRPALLPPQSFT